VARRRAAIFALFFDELAARRNKRKIERREKITEGILKEISELPKMLAQNFIIR